MELSRIKRDIFSNNSFGIIHVGANAGQERFHYDQLDLDVVWIEANPEVFTTLQHNIKDYPKQNGYQGLLTNEVGKQYEFKIANNSYSSSLFDFDLHLEMYPDVHFTDTITLTSTTLPQLIDDHQIDISKYQALLLDVEGAELLVLEGAKNILSNFDIIIAEVADFNAYKDNHTITELSSYLHKMGFFVEERRVHKTFPKGNYYDVLYKNFRYR